MGYDSKLKVRRGLTFYGRASRKASRFRGSRSGPAFVIGNGTSRLKQDLYQIRSVPQASVFACNGYYRDAGDSVPYPDFLGAVDPPITLEILEAGYAEDHDFLCAVHSLHKADTLGRVPSRCPAKLIEWDWSPGFSCGAEMVQFALLCGCDPLILVGFDGWDGQHLDNVYTGTENYSPTDPSPILFQLPWLRKRFTPRRFMQVDTNYIPDVPTVTFAQALEAMS